MAKAIPPAIIVIFGITGDLAQRKLLPALYHLFRDNLLDERTVILGITRREVSTAEMVKQVENSIEAADGTAAAEPLSRLQNSLRMHTMSQTDPAEYRELKELLDAIEIERGVCMDRLYYLSIPPQMFGPIVRNLGENGLNQSCQHGTAATRLLIEKPFGYDLASARELIEETGSNFTEDQIFRIDHYVAKDAVQNIIAYRQSVPGVEELWNARHIAAIECTVFEKLDIEGRAIFYEELGALRDFVQSHLLQMLAITAMDLPTDDTSGGTHIARLRLLESIEPIGPSDVAISARRGQYEGYTDDVSNPHSHTETFARVHLKVDSERWNGTTMTLQTGKAMSEKKADIRLIFTDSGNGEESLTFHIQPENGVTLSADSPKFKDLEAFIADFNRVHPSSAQNALGYERVLLDATLGNHQLFTTSDEVIAAWKVLNGVVEAWGQNGDGLVTYPKGADPKTTTSLS
jgi:glucose-6-phosphate 1-dehydrogenase